MQCSLIGSTVLTLMTIPPAVTEPPIGQTVELGGGGIEGGREGWSRKQKEEGREGVRERDCLESVGCLVPCGVTQSEQVGRAQQKKYMYSRRTNGQLPGLFLCLRLQTDISFIPFFPSLDFFIPFFTFPSFAFVLGLLFLLPPILRSFFWSSTGLVYLPHILSIHPSIVWVCGSLWASEHGCPAGLRGCLDWGGVCEVRTRMAVALDEVWGRVKNVCKQNGLLILSVLAVVIGCLLGFFLRGKQLSEQVSPSPVSPLLLPNLIQLSPLSRPRPKPRPTCPSPGNYSGILIDQFPLLLIVFSWSFFLRDSKPAFTVHQTS